MESKAVVTKISATSRIALKIRDNYYTVEYLEERSLPDIPDIDVEAEREMLFEAVNSMVDTEADNILKSFK